MKNEKELSIDSDWSDIKDLVNKDVYETARKAYNIAITNSTISKHEYRDTIGENKITFHWQLPQATLSIQIMKNCRLNISYSGEKDIMLENVDVADLKNELMRIVA